MKNDQENGKSLEKTEIVGKSIELLLKEYDRLVEYKKITLENYDRWFNIYLAVATAALVILIPLTQTLVTGTEPYIANLILLGLLLLGVSTFTGLSFANARSIHLERAIRHIQDYFISQEQNLEKWLYFRVTDTVVPGTGFKALVTRGVTGGSPKSILVVINSAVSVSLIIKIGIETGVLTYNYLFLMVFGSIIFLVTAFLHLAYARIVYKTNCI